MAVTLQQAVVAVSVGSYAPSSAATTISLAGAVNVGDLIAVAYAANNVNRTVSTVTDSAGTTYTAGRTIELGGSGRVQIWYGIAASTSAGQTIVITLSGSHSDGSNVFVAAFTGCASDQSGLQANGATQSGTTAHTSGSVTPSETVGVMVAVRQGSSGSYTPDASFTNTAGTTSNYGFGYRLDPASADAYDVTSADNESTVHQIVWFVGATGGGDPAPTLTSVNGGTSITMDATGQPVVGADFDTVTFELEQDDGPIALDSANEDADSADIDVVSTVTPSPKFGNATLRAINADDQQDELAVTVDPPSGTDWVEIVSLNTGDIHLEYTPALTAGDQVWWRVTDINFDETDVVVYDDGTFDLAEGLDPANVEANRRIAATGAWEGWEAIPIDDGIPDLVEVPDVVGDDEATATAALEGEGFVVTVSSDYSSSVAVGNVISQSPTGGSMAEEGSTVSIVISLGAAEGAGGGLILMRRRGRR